MRLSPLLPLLLACWTAAAPAGWLGRTLSAGLTSEQRRALGDSPDDQAVAAALTAAQRKAALARLRSAESGADAARRLEIARGYALLAQPAGSPAAPSPAALKSASRAAAGMKEALAQSRAAAQARGWLAGASPQAAAGGAPRRAPPRLSAPAPRPALERAAVPAPAAGETLGYHTGATQKPWLVTAVFQSLKDRWEFSRHDMTPAEAAKLAAIRGRIDSTPTGRQLVADLGGWKRIERDVTIKFSPISGEGTLAQAFPEGLKRPDGGYAPFGIALNSGLAGESDELMATVLSHELSHVRDDERYGARPELAVASELQAHRTQVYVYEELLKSLPEARRRQLDGDKYWEYMKFVASLWEDHILQRYPTKAAYEAQFGKAKAAILAGMAYDDMVHRVVAPGSPQLDFHVEDLYAAATREENGGGDAGVQAARQKLLGTMNAFDARYRAANGFRVEAGAR